MKTYEQMTQAELIEAAIAWTKKFGDRVTAYQTTDGDAGLLWSYQQMKPENTSWYFVSEN